MFNLSVTTPIGGSATGVTGSGGETGKAKGFANLSLEESIWVYCSPCVFVFGMTGNVLTVCVMSRRRYAGSSVRVYMLLLAIFDSAMLLCAVPPEWLETLGYLTITHLHPVICKLERFCYYASGDMSIWTLCAFTVDRFVAVCFPLLRRRPGSVLGRLTTAACPIIVVLAVAKNAHVFWTRGFEYDPITGVLVDKCGKINGYAHFETYIRPWLVFFTVSVIPFLILLLCNLAIVRALVLSERVRRGSTNKGKDGSKGRVASVSGSGGGGGGGHHHSDGGFVQTSIMCLSVSFAFLVCMVPSIILYIGRPYWTSREHPNHAYDTAKVVNRVLVCINHSISFWLYCLTGHNFRRELRAMLTCQSRREIDAKSVLAYGEASGLYMTHSGANGEFRGSNLRMNTLGVNGHSRCNSRSPSPRPSPRPSPHMSRGLLEPSRATGNGSSPRNVGGGRSPWLSPRGVSQSPSPSMLSLANRSSDEEDTRQSLITSGDQQNKPGDNNDNSRGVGGEKVKGTNNNSAVQHPLHQRQKKCGNGRVNVPQIDVTEPSSP